PRVTTDFVPKIVRHRPPTANLAHAHAVAGPEMNPDPNPVYQHQSKYGHQAVNQGRTQNRTPRYDAHHSRRRTLSILDRPPEGASFQHKNKVPVRRRPGTGTTGRKAWGRGSRGRQALGR